MPCYDPRDDEDRKETKRRLNVATRLLCEAWGLLLRNGNASDASPELAAWGIEHAALDRSRKEKR